MDVATNDLPQCLWTLDRYILLCLNCNIQLTLCKDLARNNTLKVQIYSIDDEQWYNDIDDFPYKRNQ